MEHEKEDRLKQIIEANKQKNKPGGTRTKKEFEKVGQQQKAFRNKKGGGFFDK